MRFAFYFAGEIINKHINYKLKKARLVRKGEVRMLSTRWHVRKDTKERKDELGGCLKEDIPAQQAIQQMFDMRKCFKGSSNNEKKMRLQQSEN